MRLRRPVRRIVGALRIAAAADFVSYPCAPRLVAASTVEVTCTVHIRARAVSAVPHLLLTEFAIAARQAPIGQDAQRRQELGAVGRAANDSQVQAHGLDFFSASGLSAGSAGRSVNA